MRDLGSPRRLRPGLRATRAIKKVGIESETVALDTRERVASFRGADEASAPTLCCF